MTLHWTPLSLFITYLAPTNLEGLDGAVATLCVWMVPGTWVD